MATNPYSYGSLGQRWTVGEPTSKSLLDISRVKADANRWTLEQLIPDPDTTQTLGFDLSFNSSDQRLLQIYNTDASNYFQIFGGRAASPTSDHLVFSTGTNGTIMEVDGANHWITFHDTAGLQKMYYRGDGSPGLILESGVDLTVGGTGTFSGNVTISKDAPQLIMTDSGSGGGTSDIIIDAIGSNHGFYFRADGASNHVILESNGDFKVDADTLFVDASADRVGINTASPQVDFHVNNATTNGVARISTSNAGSYAQLQLVNQSGNYWYQTIVSDNSYRLYNGSDRLTLTSAGLIGINETSPSTLLHVTEGGEPPAEGMLILEANSSSRQLRIQPPTNADNGFFDARGGNMTFLDDGTEIFRYNASTFSTSSGINVGIGTSSASAALSVQYNPATTNGFELIDSRDTNDRVLLTASGGDFGLYTTTTGVGSYASRLSVLSGGNVGIGVSSPTHSLTVAGPNTATTTGGTSALAIMDGNADNEFVNMKFQTSAGGNLAYIGAKATTTGAYPNSVGELHFGIQNGSGRFTAMVIDENRQIGIGTVSPVCRLDLAGTGGGNPTGALPSGGLFVRVTDTATVGEGAVLRLQSTNGAKETAATIAAVHTSGNNGDLTFGLYGGGATHPEGMRLTSAGNLLIGYTSSNGSYKLQVNSQIFATNATIATSDGRYKEEVQTLSNATDLVTRLNPVQFKWKSHEIHNLDVGKTDVGFIAQEVQEVLSDTDYSDSVVVTNKTDDEEYLGLGETKLIPLLTAALQEAITKIETLETKVAALEAA